MRYFVSPMSGAPTFDADSFLKEQKRGEFAGHGAYG